MQIFVALETLVLRFQPSKVKVHFDSTVYKSDEWINTQRLAKLGTHTVGAHRFRGVDFIEGCAMMCRSKKQIHHDRLQVECKVDELS